VEGGQAERNQRARVSFGNIYFGVCFLNILSLSLSSQANRIKHKRSLKWNYPPHRKIRKHFTAPLPKHFQNLLKFKLQNTKKISNFQIFFKKFFDFFKVNYFNKNCGDNVKF